MKPNRPPRRTYLVDRSFQLKYVLILGGWGLVLALIFGLWIWQAHEHAVDLVLRGGESAVERSDRHLLWALAGIAVLSSAALGLVGFLMSHRIAGPVYVMGRDLRLLAQGTFPATRSLRKGDELKNLFALFRRAVDALREREEARTAVLEDALVRVRLAAARSPELAAVVAALEADVVERRAALGPPVPIPAPAPSADVH